MSTDTNESVLEVTDLSGAVQRKTTIFMSSDNQVGLAINSDFSRVGGVQKTKGYERLGNTITTTSTSTTSSTTSSTSSTSTTTV